MAENLPFPAALTALKVGKRVRRSYWPAGRYVYLTAYSEPGYSLRTQEYRVENHLSEFLVAPVFVMVTPNYPTQLRPWNIGHDDVLAEDWELCGVQTEPRLDDHRVAPGAVDRTGPAFKAGDVVRCTAAEVTLRGGMPRVYFDLEQEYTVAETALYWHGAIDPKQYLHLLVHGSTQFVDSAHFVKVR